MAFQMWLYYFTWNKANLNFHDVKQIIIQA